MSQNSFRTGLLFISIAVIFWGMLPIALKLSAVFIDPISLTWFRFFIALLVSIGLQTWSGSIRQFTQLQRFTVLKLLCAAIFLVCNYVLFVYALAYLSPGASQLYFQTAPFFLAFGGALFFKERLSAFKLSCFATLALGMLLFFHPYLSLEDIKGSEIILGVIMVQFSALSWASYALLQKSIIKVLSPANVLLFIYAVGIVLMAPFSQFGVFTELTNPQWQVVLFCALNTLVAYGCFAQAMKYWPAAEVSAMIAITPILSFSITAAIVALNWWPTIFQADHISILSLIGIAVIILSVMVLQLYPRWQLSKNTEQ